MRTIIKSPNEEIVEGFDWSDRMAPGARLLSSTWTLESGLDGANATYSKALTQVEIQGGTANTQYKVTNLVSTTDGEEFERSFNVLVRVR